MKDPILDVADQTVRRALTRLIAELGCMPTSGTLEEATGLSSVDVSDRLQHLADAHALLLHPGTTRPWVAHPFALSPGSCWVKTAKHGYWANCLYCGFGIAAALKCDAVITTRYGGEQDTVTYEVRDGKAAPSADVFHFSTPPARWWDNVIFACSTFQPFRREDDIDAWCARHAFPRGGTMSIPQLWDFAADWYGAYVDPGWQRRTAQDAKNVFERHGLTGAFWAMD
jgi:hypothetical protein